MSEHRVLNEALPTSSVSPVNYRCKPSGLVLTEFKRLGANAKRVFQQTLSALGAQVETMYLINIVADLFVFGVVRMLQDLLQFFEAVPFPIFAPFVAGDINLELYHIPQIVSRVDLHTAFIAREVDHCVAFNQIAPSSQGFGAVLV